MANSITFNQMKEFLVKRYKHDRLYGVAPWKECPNYGDVVVQSATDDLNKLGRGLISHHESMTGQAVFYVLGAGEIVTVTTYQESIARAFEGDYCETDANS